MFYKEKIIVFPSLQHPVSVYGKYDENGLSVGLKTKTKDEKNYAVSTSPIKVEPALDANSFMDFCDQAALCDANEYNEELMAAAKDIQSRTVQELIQLLSDDPSKDYLAREVV